MIDVGNGQALAFIPARGGSKRLPRKNLLKLDGVPLVNLVIKLLIESDLFANVIVSTDDDEIADTAKQTGAMVPFRRPKELSGDQVSTLAVMQHAVDTYAQQATIAHNVVCCVYPTAVSLTPQDLAQSLEFWRKGNQPYCASITRYSHPPQRALTLNLDGSLSPESITSLDKRTQDLEPRWHDAGQFYWGTAEAWLSALPILQNAVGYEIPSSRTVDLDDVEDWKRLRMIYDSRES